MLIDPEFIQSRNGLILALIGGADPSPYRVREGVYKIAHFSFSDFLPGSGNSQVEGPWDEYPLLGKVLATFDNGRSHCEYGSYGVCDDVDQFFEHELGRWVLDSERKFTVSFSKVVNSEDDGWRWHKWGPYIGKREIECEYLREQPEIEYVYCFQVHEFVEGKNSVGSEQWG